MLSFALTFPIHVMLSKSHSNRCHISQWPNKLMSILPHP